MRWWVGGSGFAFLDTADACELVRPGARGLEVGNCTASGVLTRGLLVAEEGFERTIRFVVALDLR